MNSIQKILSKFYCLFFIMIFESSTLGIDKMNNETKPSSQINVFFNHIYAIIDEDTYDAIKNSTFLKNEFSNFEERTNANENTTWTGIYLTGESTYIELFNNKDKKKLQEGELKIAETGIAFSVDRQEEIEKIIKPFQQLFPGNIRDGLFKRNFDHSIVPWFYYLEGTNALSMKPYLSTWIMSYHQDYLKYKNINYSDNSFTRKLYN